MNALRRLYHAILAYADDPDPLVRASNGIALLIASNQPFFPLYLWFAVGEAAHFTWLTLLSTPFFLAAPAIARRNSRLGRAIAPVFGAVNTVICAYALGPASGVELFLVPCAMVAAIFYRTTEKPWMLGLIGLSLAVYLGLHDLYPASTLTTAEHARLFFINLMSVTGLTLFIGLTHASVLSQIEEQKSR